MREDVAARTIVGGQDLDRIFQKRFFAVVFVKDLVKIKEPIAWPPWKNLKWRLTQCVGPQWDSTAEPFERRFTRSVCPLLERYNSYFGSLPPLS